MTQATISFAALPQEMTAVTMPESPAANFSIYTTMDIAADELQKAFNKFPLTVHFCRVNPILAFDPNVIQHDFDPFDLAFGDNGGEM